MLGQVFYIVFLSACHYARILGRVLYSVRQCLPVCSYVRSSILYSVP